MAFPDSKKTLGNTKSPGRDLQTGKGFLSYAPLLLASQDSKLGGQVQLGDSAITGD